MSAFQADAAAVYAFTGAFFSALAEANVEHIVISPGSRSTPLAISAERTDPLRTWIELDERAAAFFALGIAKATGRPAALVCTSGTAAANYLPAVIEAHYSRVPLIILSADRPPELRDWGAGQTIEQPGLYGRYPRWTAEVPIPTEGEDALRFAVQLAARSVANATGAPGRAAGAVHLNWPLREPLAPPALDPSLPAASDASAASSPCAAESGFPGGPAFTQANSIADPGDVADLVDRVRRVERGVLCAGPMAASPEWGAALARFAELSGWPLLADPASSLRALVNGTEAAGSAPILDLGDVLTRTPGFAKRMQPDFVLRIGETPVSKAQRLWIEGAAPAEIWWLDDGLHWGEPSHRATRVLQGGGLSLLEAASDVLAGGAGQGEKAETSEEADKAESPQRFRERAWCQAFEQANAEARVAVDACAGREGAWSGVPIAAALTRAMPEGGVLFSSNSMSIRLLEVAYANSVSPFRILCSRGASGIDGINSTALGVAAGLRKPTALLTGDLAFLHDLSGLLLARRESLPLTLVVLDDNGGGIFSFLPVAAQGEAVAFEKLFHTPHDLDLAKVAALFEVDYHRANSVAELEAALAISLPAPGVSIVHARVDAAANAAGFREIIAAGVGAVEAILPKLPESGASE
ncbi:MAG: 2-succinyl-5-enolpyruvyl-6-hydroxy-3-cyclohexene-1-carboxylic-acid synthase [Myxococcota bacterium]